jgi:hypothetical protein
MKFLLSLILLVLIGVGVYWFLAAPPERSQIEQAGNDLAASAERMKEAVQDRLGDFSLRSDDIKQELEKTGKVARKKAKEIGTAVADATADARITGAIKAKYVGDPDLSALSISVNTTDGIVTLSGSASSHESIGKAMLLALETEGVKEVVSTLQVRQTKSTSAKPE